MLHMERACAPHDLNLQTCDVTKSEIRIFQDVMNMMMNMMNMMMKGHLYKAKPTAPALMEQDTYTA